MHIVKTTNRIYTPSEILAYLPVPARTPLRFLTPHPAYMAISEFRYGHGAVGVRHAFTLAFA
jgi:hypothetical protein